MNQQNSYLFTYNNIPLFKLDIIQIISTFLLVTHQKKFKFPKWLIIHIFQFIIFCFKSNKKILKLIIGGDPENFDYELDGPIRTFWNLYTRS